MCGIAGVIGASITETDGRRMAAALADMVHREPDDGHVDQASDWILGFRRLAILDLNPTGRQPMATPDGGAILVFNGEIYNYVELRDRLEPGTALRSTGDAEVLLNLLRARGSGALPLLNGMFAFAFIDRDRRRFILARDRLGVKPLYYTLAGGRLTFASELEPLVRLLPERPDVSPLAVNRYIAMGHINPPLTIYDGVYKLRPGHYLEGSLDDVGSAVPVEWWWLTNEVDRQRSPGEWLTEIETLLSDAVKLRLRSDVPLGVFLSGGIDSGLVTHYAARHAGGSKPRALTVTFAEEKYSEEAVATQVAAAEGLDHVLIPVAMDDLDDMPRILAICGEPFDDSSILNQYHLSRKAREHATVFLSGDAGDESFGGYREYLRVAMNETGLRLASRAIYPLVPLLDRLIPRDSLYSARIWKFAAKGDDFGAIVRQGFRDPWARALVRDDVRASLSELEGLFWQEWSRSEGMDLVTRMQRLDLRIYLESDVLTKVDRASMAHSIEVRSPFLDYRLVELAGRIPVDLHFDRQRRRGKRLLRALAEKRLPAGVYDKPKKGFSLPIGEWVRGPLARPLEDLLTSRASVLGRWVDMQAVGRLFRANADPAKRRFAADCYIWRLLMLDLWERRVVRGQDALPFEVPRGRVRV